MASIYKYSIKEKYLSYSYFRKYLNKPIQLSNPNDVINAGITALDLYPNEWIIYSILGDYYQQVGNYSESLWACKKAYDLHPKHLIVTYGLASSYRMLTRASWTKDEEKIAQMISDLYNFNQTINIELSKQELLKTSLLIEIAALQAIRWFEHSLTLNPDKKSRKQIEWDLDTMYKSFPHLKR